MMFSFQVLPPPASASIAAMQNAVLAFVDDIYEDLELWYPKLRLEEAGYSTRLAAKELRTFTGQNGYPAKADLLLDDARGADFAFPTQARPSGWPNLSSPSSI